jgi:hypothetical protein
MKTFLLASVIMLQSILPPSTSVYVCRSVKGKRYHLQENCKGLRNCKHTVVKIKLADAKKQGLTLCGWEK